MTLTQPMLTALIYAVRFATKRKTRQPLVVEAVMLLRLCCELLRYYEAIQP